MKRPNKNWVLYKDAPVEVHDLLADKRGCGNCGCTIEDLDLAHWMLIEKYMDWWIIINVFNEHRKYHIYARAFRTEETDLRRGSIKTEQVLLGPDKLPPWHKIVVKHANIHKTAMRLIERVKGAAGEVHHGHKTFGDDFGDRCCCCGF